MGKIVQKKICLLGDFAVGKTSLVRRFVEGRFDETYLSTVGVNISRKPVERADYTLNFLLWDLSGGDDHSSRISGYLRGAAGAIIVCDVTRDTTRFALTRYANHFLKLNPKSPFVMAINKADLLEQRQITHQQLDDISENLGQAPFLYTSAKDGANVEASFALLADLIEKR